MKPSTCFLLEPAPVTLLLSKTQARMAAVELCLGSSDALQNAEAYL